MIRTDTEDLKITESYYMFSPRYLLGKTHETYLNQNDSEDFYSLINPDDHDKYLVDPAQRLERQKELERVVKTSSDVKKAMDEEYIK